MEPDFSGYATKAGLRCSDGRIIKAEAFQHMDGKQVPLVWQHGHSNIENVLGHAKLEVVSDGVRAHGYFNNSTHASAAKEAVQHGDIDRLSIYANQLTEHGKIVHSGNIREVSLVLAGANPGAKIDYVRIQHSEDPDDFSELNDEAIIHTGIQLDVVLTATPVEDNAKIEHADADEKNADEETGEDIYNSLNEKQKNLVHFMIGAAINETSAPDEEEPKSDDNTAEHSETTSTDEEGALAHKEGTNDMTSRNVFEQNDAENQGHTLSHADLKSIVQNGIKMGSFKEAAQAYALAHGIDSIDLLFPDAKNLTSTPEFDKRRTEWVAGVLGTTRHTPFSRVKTMVADLTLEDARAKGYVKGEYKKEEFFGISKRVTTPTTVYKKQKLDRDDILDITEFDVVTWMWGEMRLMLEEEIARAILIGDGRDVSHEDKIKDPIGAAEGSGIRSVANDHELYVTTLNVNLDDTNSNYEEVVDAVMDGMEYYKGTGTPTFYTTIKHLNGFKKAKDLEGRRYYKNNAEVAEALGVDRIVTVEPMNDVSDLVGIIVNLTDYNIGADKGGEIARFDDFDIDYNQFKYLLETRLSGALTKVKSALVIRKSAAAATQVTPLKPTFVASTGVVTIPTVTGVTYKNATTDATLSAGAQSAIAAGATIKIKAVPSSASYFFADTVVDGPWTFKRDAS